jgi:hypothetical protein
MLKVLLVASRRPVVPENSRSSYVVPVACVAGIGIAICPLAWPVVLGEMAGRGLSGAADEEYRPSQSVAEGFAIPVHEALSTPPAAIVLGRTTRLGLASGVGLGVAVVTEN